MFKVDALLDAVDGAKLVEVRGPVAGDLFQQDWDDDWDDAARRHGDNTTAAHLYRSNAQR